jgi:hypothetical protein
MTKRSFIAVVFMLSALAPPALAQTAQPRTRAITGLRARTVLQNGNQAAQQEVKQGNVDARQQIREGNQAAREAAAAGDMAGAHEAKTKSRRDARETRRDAHQAAHETRDAAHDAAAAMLAAPGLRPDETPVERAERHRLARLARWGAIGPRIGMGPIPPGLTAEFLLHARRIAYLNRIRVLAGTDAALTARIEAILARETARHEAEVTTQAVATPGAAAAASVSVDVNAAAAAAAALAAAATAGVAVPAPTTAVAVPMTAAGAQ